MTNRTQNFLTNENQSNFNLSNVFIPYSQAENSNSFLKVVTPQYDGRKNFYSRVNTSPVKRKSEESGEYDCIGKTMVKLTNKEGSTYNNKDFQFSQNIKDNKENDFLSPNMLNSANGFNRFTSNSQARNQVRYLISEGTLPEQKPTLNMVESRNKLIDFSKKKVWGEDIKKETEEDDAMKKTKVTKEDLSVKENEENQNEEEEEWSDELVEEDLEEEQAKKQRLSEIEKNLPVPVNKKNDEKFKILKMREMRRESLPSNKSAKTNDLQYSPYEKSFVNGNYNF